MATGAHSSISSFDKTGTQYLAATDTFSDESNPVSVFWNKNDNIKQIIHTSYTKEIPSTISTKNESWAGTQVFSISTDTDAVGNLYLSVVIELDTPEAQLDPGPPKTLTTLLRRPSTKESITDWDLTEPLLHRIRGVKKGSKKPEGVQIGYPNGWREDTTGSQYPRPLDNIHPFMPPEDLPSYPNWDWKPRDFLQLNEIPVNRTTKQTLSEFLSGSSYYGGATKEFMFNPDMRVSKHSKLVLFGDREEYSLGDPRPLSVTMNGYYSSTLKESPNYLGHDNFISDSLVEAPYQTTYRPHDLSYIPKYLSHTDSKRLRRTGNEHFHLNPDGTYGLYSSIGVLADDLLTSYLTLDDINKLVEHYNNPPVCDDMNNLATDSSGTYSCKDRIEWLKTTGGLTDSAAREQVAQEFPDICKVCPKAINKLVTPPDNRATTSADYTALPDDTVSSLFGSQDGKCPVGYPNIVSNHTFDVGEKLFTESGEFISENTDNPPDGSYSFSLERIDPIPDVRDVSPSHQNEDHYGYATAISKDGNTLAVSQGRMYGCEQESNNQALTDALHEASRTKAPVSNPRGANWPYGEDDPAHTAAWGAALDSGAILFPMNPKRAGKVRVYKKIDGEWVFNKAFSATDSNLDTYPQGAKSIKRPGVQDYIYVDPINPQYIPGITSPVIPQKTPWATGCKHHISLSGDGNRIVIGEAGGPNNAVTTYDYSGGNDWNLVDTKISGAAAVNNSIEQYFSRGVYTGDSSYTFPDPPPAPVSGFGIYPLPTSVWGSGFGNNVQLSSDGNILVVTSYMSPASVFKWTSGSWSPMGTGITHTADSVSISNDGKTLVTSNFTTNYAGVWDYDDVTETWSSSDFLPLRHFLPDTDANYPRGTTGAKNALESGWAGASAAVALVAEGPGGGGDSINSCPVRISGDGSRIVIGSPRAFGDDSRLEPALLKIYTRLTPSNSNLPYSPPGPGHPNWVQFNDSSGPHQFAMEPGEFSISENGNRIAVGSPISDNYSTPHLPLLATQVMLLGTQQTQIVQDIPWTSSSDNVVGGGGRDYKRPKIEAGKIRVYDIVGNEWIEVIGEIKGENGELNKGDSHSHISSQNFHNMFLYTGGSRQGETLVVKDGTGGVTFDTPAALTGTLPAGTSMTIAASCKFTGFGTGDWPNTLSQGPIITLGSSGPYGKFSIHPIDFDTNFSEREWDLIGVTFHAAPQILVTGSTWAATTVTGGYIYPPVTGMNEQYYPPSTKLATQLGVFLANKGDTNFYVVSKEGSIISFYVNGKLIGRHDYTAEETGYGSEIYDSQSHIGWDGVSQYISGEVTNVGIWNRGLTESEVLTTYNGNAKLPNLSDNGVTGSLVYSEYESVINESIEIKKAKYEAVRYDGELSTTWTQPWNQYGGIDFITNYFSVYGGYSRGYNDLVYGDQYNDRGSKGEGLGWSISMSGDGNDIISGAPYMSTIGATVAVPRRSYREVGRAYAYKLKKIQKSIQVLPKRPPGKIKMTIHDAAIIVNDAQKRLNHDITDFFNIPQRSSSDSGSLNWTKQWDTVPVKAVNPPKLEDYTNPYWAKSNLKPKVIFPLSKIIEKVELQVGSQIWQTLTQDDIAAINATEMTESAYNSLGLQCSGLVRSDGTRETFGDAKWIPGKKYQAIIPIPILTGNNSGKFQNYKSHRHDGYLNCLAREQEVKIKIKYSNVEDIFHTEDLYAYQGYEAPIYTGFDNINKGKYITNVPELWNPKIKLQTKLYGEYITLAKEEKNALKASPDRIYKKIKSAQNITFYKLPEVLHRDAYVDIKLDEFSIYSSHFIISLDFPGITNKSNIPYLDSADIILNGTTHSGIVKSNSLLAAAKSLGLYSNELVFDKDNFDKLFYVFPLASRAFGGSSIPLNRFDDVILRIVFSSDGGIPDEGINVPIKSKVSITCRGETNLYYHEGASAISLF